MTTLPTSLLDAALETRVQMLVSWKLNQQNVDAVLNDIDKLYTAMYEAAQLVEKPVERYNALTKLSNRIASDATRTAGAGVFITTFIHHMQEVQGEMVRIALAHAASKKSAAPPTPTTPLVDKLIQKADELGWSKDAMGVETFDVDE